MELRVVTPFGSKVEQDGVDEVVAPGVLGELGIRDGHLPLITALSVGRFVVHRGADVRTFMLDGGYLEVSDDKVLVTTELCEAPDDIDVDRAKRQLKDAEDALKNVDNQADDKRGPFERRIKRAHTRLAVASHTSGH